MKRGTPEHPKTEHLAILLQIPVAQAVGHLEMLFHFTGRYSPQGDIGRWPDAMVATRCGWSDDAEPFIAAMVEAGWIERNETHRLVVHDWPEHAEDTVRKALEARGLTFWDGSAARSNHSRTPRESFASQSPPPSRAEPSPALPRLSEPTPSLEGGSVGAAVAGRDDHEFTERVRERCNSALRKLPRMKKRSDRSLLWKVCALAERSEISEDDLDDSIEAVTHGNGKQNPWAYFSACLKTRIGDDRFKALLAREDEPP